MTPQTATVSEKTVREVLRGLMALALFIWGGVFGMYYKTGHVDPSIIVAATGITSGLVGLVSLRHGPDTSQKVDAPNAETVNISQQPEPQATPTEPPQEPPTP